MKSTRSLTALLLLASFSGFGCSEQIEGLVKSQPWTAPILGGRVKPSPFVLKLGNIQGFVFGASGKSQPIPLAFVSTGSISSFAGNPDKNKAIPEDEEFKDPKDDLKKINVYHTFDPEVGPVECERIVRKNPPGATSGMSEEEVQRLPYVYLRAGEFFLEGVPEGITNLNASFGNVVSSTNPITVYANNTVTDVSMNLFIPEPVSVEDKRVPKVVEWVDLKPETGISVNAQIKKIKTEFEESTEITINYKPDPPDVAVTLKAPPGSAGAVIKSIDVVYVYNTPARQRASLPPIQIGPIRIPISPVVVAPAQDIAFGPPSVITIPVGSATLRTVFQSDKADEQPGLIVANMEFIDDAGFAIQDKTFQNLQVSAVLRSL